jgi:uncharacterized membrane protein
MLDIPGALASPREQVRMDAPHPRNVVRGGGWILAGNAMRGQGGSKLITVGRVLIGIAAILFGVEHFLHPSACPGVPLQKIMPDWIPGRLLIGYMTGAILLVAGVAILLAEKTRMAATYLGTWVVLLVVFIYGPILIAALADPSTEVKVEGSTTSSICCCLPERISRSPARRHARIRMPPANLLRNWDHGSVVLKRRSGLAARKLEAQAEAGGDWQT